MTIKMRLKEHGVTSVQSEVFLILGIIASLDY